MRLHLKNEITQETRMNVTYAHRHIDVPVVGLKDELQYYYQDEQDKPTFDSRTHRLVRNEEWTNDAHPEHAHLKKYAITWSVVQLTNEEIIENLTQALGQYLDTQYPLWERIKHLSQFNQFQKNGITSDPRIDWLQSQLDWVTSCRQERDAQEASLTNDNILPSFTFSARP